MWSVEGGFTTGRSVEGGALFQPCAQQCFEAKKRNFLGIKISESLTELAYFSTRVMKGDKCFLAVWLKVCICIIWNLKSGIWHSANRISFSFIVKGSVVKLTLIHCTVCVVWQIKAGWSSKQQYIILNVWLDFGNKEYWITYYFFYFSIYQTVTVWLGLGKQKKQLLRVRKRSYFSSPITLDSLSQTTYKPRLLEAAGFTGLNKPHICGLTQIFFTPLYYHAAVFDTLAVRAVYELAFFSRGPKLWDRDSVRQNILYSYYHLKWLTLQCYWLCRLMFY